MKKILHLSHTEIPYDSRILKEMESAYNNGYEVYGIGIEQNENNIPIVNNKFQVTTLNLFSKKLKFLPKSLRHSLTFLEFFLKSISTSIRVKPDLIHCNDTIVLPIGIFIKFLTKSKLIYDAHELESNKNGLSTTLSKVTLFTEKLLWNFVDGLIVVSPSIQRWYMENIGYKESAIVLNSPIFGSQSTEKSTYLRDKFHIPKNSKVFIYVGILGPGRGIDLIIDSFKTVKNAHIVFLGHGNYSTKIKQLEKIYPNYHFHDSVVHNKVVEIVSSADIGLCLIENVSLSDYYCLPNKLFEYIFSGLPVLASNFPDIQCIVEKYSLGTCVDLNSESIRAGISSFVSNDVPYHPKSNTFFELSWEKQEENLINLYSKLIDK